MPPEETTQPGGPAAEAPAAAQAPAAQPMDAYCPRCADYRPLVVFSHVQVIQPPVGAGVLLLRCAACGGFIASAGSIPITVQPAQQAIQPVAAHLGNGLRHLNRTDRRRLGLS